MINTQIDFNKQFKIFKQNISLTEKQRQELMETRQDIRKVLRQEFSGVKFMTQGSYAYRTLNYPCNVNAGQQMDLDDGMYIYHDLPDGEEPNFSPKDIFNRVDKVLSNLSEEKGWNFTGEKKTCARIEIAGDKHIDVPIYVISEAKGKVISNLLEFVKVFDFNESLQDQYDAGDVWLALRDGTWQQSDPRLIVKHVEQTCKNHNPHSYRDVVRFFKAWRDYQFEKSKWSSICLMVAIDQAMQKVSDSIKRQGTINTIHATSMQLVEIMKQQPIYDPVDKEVDLKDKIPQTELTKIVQGLSKLMENCQSAQYHNTSKYLIQSFGKRFPLCPENRPQTSQTNTPTVSPVRFGRNTSSA